MIYDHGLCNFYSNQKNHLHTRYIVLLLNMQNMFRVCYMVALIYISFLVCLQN